VTFLLEGESFPPELHAEPEEENQAENPENPEFNSLETLQEKSFYAYDDERYRWHTIRVNNREKVLDLKLIEPYMKVITHGGETRVITNSPYLI
jgi:hypothetical protein